MASSQAAAFSPCHITGFFQAHLGQKDLAKVGSTGAGVTIEQGVLTEVSIRRSPRAKITVSFNGRPLRNPVVSESVVRQFLRSESGGMKVQVSHQSTLPIGTGYGTSGAGALGLSLALNEALGRPITSLEAAGVAHKSEVICRTGLGTVTSEFHGGFLVRMKPGAPGTSQVCKFPFSKSARILSTSYGPIATSRILSQSDLIARVNSCGKTLVARLMKKPRLEAFVGISRIFADCLNMMSPKLRQFVKFMDRAGIMTSMMMIGNAAFTVVPSDDVRAVSMVVRKLGRVPLTSKISLGGAHLL